MYEHYHNSLSCGDISSSGHILIYTKKEDKMRQCSKCGTDKNLTEHHIHPVRYFGRKKNQLKICLCRDCHDQIETIIRGVESFIGNVPFGTHFQLYKSSYEKIAESYLHHSTLIYLQT